MPASAADQWIELVTEGTTASQRELPGDLDRETLRDVAEWEQAAALAQMALQQTQSSELPPSLRAKLAQQAMTSLALMPARVGGNLCPQHQTWPRVENGVSRPGY